MSVRSAVLTRLHAEKEAWTVWETVNPSLYVTETTMGTRTSWSPAGIIRKGRKMRPGEGIEPCGEGVPGWDVSGGFEGAPETSAGFWGPFGEGVLFGHIMGILGRTPGLQGLGPGYASCLPC